MKQPTISCEACGADIKLPSEEVIPSVQASTLIVCRDCAGKTYKELGLDTFQVSNVVDRINRLGEIGRSLFVHKSYHSAWEQGLTDMRNRIPACGDW